MIVAILPGGTRRTFRTDEEFLLWNARAEVVEGVYALSEIASASSDAHAGRSTPAPLERVGPSS